jgi:hypothetical protein
MSIEQRIKKKELFGVYRFLEIRGTSWWLFRAVMLHEKIDLR